MNSKLFALATATALALGTGVARDARAQDGAGEWPSYSASGANAKYSPLAQIDRTNVHRLRVAWRARSVDYGVLERHRELRLPETSQTTPLVLGGRVLIATGLGVAAALDPGSGELLWFHDPYARGETIDPRALRRAALRSGTTWRSGAEERLLYVGNGDLVSLDAKTGLPDPAFGQGGRVDLRVTGGAPLPGFFWTSPPTVCRDTVVIGGSTNDEWTHRRAEPGPVRGYDVRSGALRWAFHTIPRAGEAGHETWEDGAAERVGAANVWTWMACDEELGYVYAPTSTPHNDWYGGHRLGAGLYGESLLCLDARTGERIWHFQAVHHGLWDFDFPAGPILADITVAGRRIRAVAQVSKQAYLYVFDRVTGESVWPIVELPAPPSQVPGERAWPTQPHPSWPRPYDLQGLKHDDLIDFTPELRAEAFALVARYHLGPLFQPPTLVESEGEGWRATIQSPGPVGGSNWSGAALDPETNVLYVPSVTAPVVMGLRTPPDPARSDLRYRVDLGEADGYAFLQLADGLPITKPPYGRITAIDLDGGAHRWVAPNGDGPRRHPRLRHLDLPPLGQPGRVAPLLTRTLLFVADGSPDTVVQPPGGGGRALRAFDKATGEVVHELTLDAGVSAAPITYLFRGKQYLLLTLSERGHDHEWVALALPDSLPD